jgi:hypothetical protein
MYAITTNTATTAPTPVDHTSKAITWSNSLPGRKDLFSDVQPLEITARSNNYHCPSGRCLVSHTVTGDSGRTAPVSQRIQERFSYKGSQSEGEIARATQIYPFSSRKSRLSNPKRADRILGRLESTLRQLTALGRGSSLGTFQGVYAKTADVSMIFDALYHDESSRERRLKRGVSNSYQRFLARRQRVKGYNSRNQEREQLARAEKRRFGFGEGRVDDIFAYFSQMPYEWQKFFDTEQNQAAVTA